MLVKFLPSLSLIGNFFNCGTVLVNFHSLNFFNAGNWVVNVHDKREDAKKNKIIKNQDVVYSLFKFKDVINFQSRKLNSGAVSG